MGSGTVLDTGRKTEKISVGFLPDSKVAGAGRVGSVGAGRKQCLS